MASFLRHRDPKTGKFTKFRANKKLTREVYTESNKKIGDRTSKYTSKEGGYTGIWLTLINGKRAPAVAGQDYRRGWVYKDGVPIFRLKSFDVLTQGNIDAIDEYIQDFEVEPEDFIEDELYPEFYEEQ